MVRDYQYGFVNSAILLDWIPPLDGTPDRYRIRWREYGSAVWEAETTENTEFVITGLTNYTRYEFRVNAADCAGNGASTSVVDLIVHPYPYATTPQGITFTFCLSDIVQPPASLLEGLSWSDTIDAWDSWIAEGNEASYTYTLTWDAVHDDGGAPVLSYDVHVERAVIGRDLGLDNQSYNYSFETPEPIVVLGNDLDLDPSASHSSLRATTGVVYNNIDVTNYALLSGVHTHSYGLGFWLAQWDSSTSQFIDYCWSWTDPSANSNAVPSG